MDILQVEAPLVCTRRVAGLQQISLRILRDRSGRNWGLTKGSLCGIISS